MWRRFIVVEIRIFKKVEMYFYLIFSFLGFIAFDKQTMNLFEDGEDFGFLNFIWLDRKV